MAKINLKALDRNIFIRGDDAAARTITIGRTDTFNDVVVIDSAQWSVTAAGAATFSGLITGNGGFTSPTSSSGASNEAFGSGALGSITSAFGCNAVGKDALGNVTTGGVNMGYGLNAGSGIVTGDSNMCIGPNTLTRADVTACTAVGVSACREITAGPNMGIGSNACKGDNSLGGSGTNNLAVGNNSMQSFTTGINNTAVGNDALRDVTTGNNTIAIGRQAGQSNTTGSNNVYIGAAAGRDNVGSDNIFIGDGVGNTETTASNTLRIHNAGGSSTPIIEGVMSTNDNRIGINTKTLNAKFNVVVGATDSPTVDCFEFTQNDASEAFGNFAATEAAGVGQPITTWVNGNSIQRFAKFKLNGTLYYIPFYNAPTS